MWKRQTEAVWFCNFAFWPLSLSRCPGWFGVLENPLVAFLLRVALHQGKGIASHGEASETSRRRFSKLKKCSLTCCLSCAGASGSPHRRPRAQRPIPLGKISASPQSCSRRHTWQSCCKSEKLLNCKYTFFYSQSNRIPTNLSPMPSWPFALSLICIPCPWHADKPITAGADLRENKYEQTSSEIKNICSDLPRVSKQLLEPILTRDPSWTFGGSFGY